MMAESSAVPLLFPTLQGKVRRWTAPYRYAAAAITITAIVGTALLIKSNQKGATDPIARHNDVAPGGNKAILQLSDGSQIVLDSARNGNLAQQGAFKVIKLADGQLAYQAAGQSGSTAANDNTTTAPNTAVSFNTITTPRGGQYAVILPDGTKAWLNAASRLRFPTHFTGQQRQVECSGEAYFEVAKDDQHPFILTTSSMQIAVLGTAFDVEAYPDEPTQKATLLQGAVKVSTGGQQSLLQPGQQACIANENGSTLQLTTPQKATDVIAWKNGLFSFKADSIQTVMRQIARWYDVEVVYEGQGTIDQEFFGKIPRSVPASTLLKILESTRSVHFTIEGKKIIVSPGSEK